MLRFFFTTFIVSCIFTCVYSQSEVCGDNVDNDTDILTDCADPDVNCAECSEAFVCANESNLYQYSNDTLFERIDGIWTVVPGWTNTLNQSTIEVNAIGYNVRDGFLYGIDRNNGNLITINRSGITSSNALTPPLTGTISSPSTNWFIGDMDLSGHLYIATTSNNNPRIAIIDVESRTSEVLPITGLPSGVSLDISDWTYLPATGKLYGLSASAASQIRIFDLDGTYDTTIPLSGVNCSIGFGAVFSDVNGIIYGSCNSGEFYEFLPNTDFTEFTPNQLPAASQTFGANDGASCPLANRIPRGSDCCLEVLKILRRMESTENPPTEKVIHTSKTAEKPTKVTETRKKLGKLNQNQPNPFNGETVLPYKIRERYAKSASISIFSMNGTEVATYVLPIQGKGSVIVSSDLLSPGTYIYTLVVNGRIEDTKRMIVGQ